IWILAVLCFIIVVSEWLVRKTFLRHLGTALLAIIVTAIVANLGIIPAGSPPESPVAVYDGIFEYIAPLAIFWLVLPVNLKSLLRAGLPMISLFLIGAAGTTIGVFVGMWLVNGAESIGPLYGPLGGMFAGTYIGGSVNFNAVALNYDVVRNGLLYGGAVVVDNIITTLWMIGSLALPRLLHPLWRTSHNVGYEGEREVLLGIDEDTETLHPVDVSLMLGLGFISLWFSQWVADMFEGVPMILVLTVVALVLAQIPAIARLKGAKVIGMFTVYVFLAVIGAFCDVRAMGGLGDLGVTLLIFAGTVVTVHAVFTLGAAWILNIDPEVAVVASQSNVGGSTSSLAIARSLGREDLVLPGILTGLLGNALGTFVGFWVASML
ncbi:MAG: DUF819 family protein, partial [Rhodothermales bacterium]